MALIVISIMACGGREHNAAAFMFLTLDFLHARRGVELLIERGQTGAD
jgi:hypothetical protein